MLPLRGPTKISIFLFLLLVICQINEEEARENPGTRYRKKSRKPSNVDQELDQFSGDAYSEFVDKYYGGPGKTPIEMIGGGGERLNNHDSSKKSNSNRGRVYSEGGSGYKKTSPNFDNDDEDYDEDEDDDEADDFESSGDFPTEFDGAYGRNNLNTDDEDYFRKSKFPTKPPPPPPPPTTTTTTPKPTIYPRRRLTKTIPTTTTTTSTPTPATTTTVSTSTFIPKTSRITTTLSSTSKETTKDYSTPVSTSLNTQTSTSFSYSIDIDGEEEILNVNPNKIFEDSREDQVQGSGSGDIGDDEDYADNQTDLKTTSPKTTTTVTMSPTIISTPTTVVSNQYVPESTTENQGPISWPPSNYSSIPMVISSTTTATATTLSPLLTSTKTTLITSAATTTDQPSTTTMTPTKSSTRPPDTTLTTTTLSTTTTSTTTTTTIPPPPTTTTTTTTTKTTTTTTTITTTTTTTTTTTQSLSTTVRPPRRRSTLPTTSTTERTIHSTTDYKVFGQEYDLVPTVLVSNHVLVIALYTSLVIILCVSILISLCLVLKWRTSYMLANGSEEGSNSDSTSSDLPMLKGRKGKILMGRTDLTAAKNHFSKQESPSSPPPLFPPDFTLASRSSLAQRKKRDKDGTETCKSWFNRNKKLDETSKVKKGNDWY